MKEQMLGFEIDTRTIDEIVEDALGSIADHQADGTMGGWLACINPHSYVVSLDDAIFKRSLRAATWLIPDGVGILLASKILGGRVAERVTGPDFFHALTSQLNTRGGSTVFFLGSTEENLDLIRARMIKDYPNVRVVGTYSPPFRPAFAQADTEAMCEAVNSARPDVLWVGMTAPKQEKWLSENMSRLDVGFAAAVGAVFDFYAGKVKRSHPVFQRLGLEWLPRLAQQPQRLWRRMFVSAPIFLAHVARAKWLLLLKVD